MDPSRFLSELLVKNVKVRFSNGKLICRGEKGNINEDDVSQLRLFRDQLIGLMDGNDLKAGCNFYPLSYSQQSLWAIYNVDKKNPAYNVYSVFKLKNSVDLNLLEECFNSLIEKHSILRTRYASIDGIPIQLELDEAKININRVNAKSWGKKECADWIQTKLDSPFDLEAGQLMEVVCIDECPDFVDKNVVEYRNDASIDSQAEDDEVGTCKLLILKVHHIAVDHWSLMIFVEQVIDAYGARILNKPLQNVHVVSEYSQHIVQELNLINSDQSESLLEYWSNQLDDELPKLNLPVDFPYPPVQTYIGQSYSTLLDIEQGKRIKELAKKTGVTPFVMLLSVFELFLHRVSQQNDIIVGCPSFGRTNSQTFDVLGDFVNPLPLRTRFSADMSFTELLKLVKKNVFEGIERQAYPFPLLVQKLNASGDVSRPPVFQVLFNWNRQAGNETFDSFEGDHHFIQDFVSGASTGASGITHEINLTITEHPDTFRLGWKFNKDLFSTETSTRLIECFIQLLNGVVDDVDKTLSEYALLDGKKEEELLNAWKGNIVDIPDPILIHKQIAARSLQLADNRALSFRDESYTYRELDEVSNQLAHYLIAKDINAGDRVGICIDRSMEMVVALLATLKAGAAYVPLDPNYPEERIAYIIEDAKLTTILTQEFQCTRLTQFDTSIAVIDLSAEGDFLKALETYPRTKSEVAANGDAAAYMIYTSGSSGKPKGVVISHNNVANFFSGMDEALSDDFSGVWLAVTSISFDISVLEIFWTLARGYEVVVQPDSPNIDGASGVAEAKHMDFSLFYFAADQKVNETDKYRLLFEGAKYADENGFSGIWVPERHFHQFGGAYPNPSVTAAAIASMTKNIQIRSGSVVLPLHDTIRVAEEWSMVDNISNGRVGLSFASGWQPNDFVLAPDNFENRREILGTAMKEVVHLWQGNPLKRVNGVGQEIEVKLYPSPIQKELPIWVTAAGNPETFRQAGATGSHLLTHLLGQNRRELSEKIGLYRKARKAAGYDPDTGKVTLMLHTFVGEDVEEVKAMVKEPFKNYLKTSLNLFKPVLELDREEIDPKEQEELMAQQAFNRYFSNNALMGTVESCLEFVNELKQIGVDEIGCLIDFGVDEDCVLESLPRLQKLLSLANSEKNQYLLDNINRYKKNYISPEVLIQKHVVTHLQCTPSYAQMLLENPSTKASLANLEKLLVGGEALSQNLAKRLKAAGVKNILNMYGPTEATVWCSYQNVGDNEKAENANGIVPIGQPMTNIQFYILDQYQKLLPKGIAGELFVSGKSLASGYFEREFLTAERFVNNPFLVGEKMYRTGDQVRLNNTNTLEFVGRIDNQVKIRGHRIEVGEIEAQLLKYESISQAIVVVRGSGGSIQLVAYIVKNDNDDIELSTTIVKQYLSSYLPQYMVPNIIVTLDKLPLTPNGKVDRKALPTPSQCMQDKPFVAPESEFDKLMVEIWQEVLNVDAVGMNDNFFDLGGHSLMAIQLSSRVLTSVSRDVPVTGVFEYPELAAFSQFVELLPLSSEQRNEYPEISPADRSSSLPLSYAQTRLWFLDQYENNQSATYNIPLVLAMKGKVDVELLKESFRIIVGRHEALRTQVGTRNGEPVQEVLPGSQLNFALQQTTLDELDEKLREEIHAPFNLKEGPLVRVRLFESDDEEHVLCITQHHIIGDGWSTGILIRELGECYTALYEKRTPSLEDIKLQYSDFSAWQGEWLQGKILEEKIAFWRERLSDLPTMQMPTDYTRPSLVTYKGRNVFFKVDDELIRPLKAISRKAKSTFFTTLFTAFNILISRYCGADDVVIGTPVANRPSRQLESIFGLFVNMLAMRSDLSGNPTFIELIQRVSKNAFEVFENQDVPFEQLVNNIGVERDPSRAPLFQIMFTLENESEEVLLRFPGIEAGIEKVEYEVAKYDISLILRETQRGLIGALEYNKDLFKEETIEQIGRHYCQLLETIVNEPETRIGEVQFLSQQEQYRQLVEWNDTEQLFSQSTLCMHELFVEQAKKTPRALAVVFNNKSYSYGEIYSAAFRLSQQLVGSNSQTIAVMIPRGVLQVVAVLAVQMAGSAYVPVDTRWPEDRQSEIISASEAKIILSDQAFDEGTAAREGMKNINIADIDFTFDAALFEEPLSKVAISEMAYIIFTSGSTGKPKGVVMDHRSVVNTLLDINQRFNICEKDRIFALSELSFDLSVYDIFGTLAAGAALVIPEPQRVMEPTHWAELCVENDVSLWNSVPALMQLYVDYLDEKEDFHNNALKHVLLSGDWLPVTLPDRIRRYFPQANVISLGGATEAAIWSIHYPIDVVDPLWTSIPYGRALANQKFYVLNDHFQVCPVGVVGNLFIAGKGLAQGYWKDKEKTENSFMPHPETGERLYKTGDLGRYLPDGNIEFIGRVDFQVKVNGYRIELGEIESRLSDHPGITTAIAVISKNQYGLNRIVCYYLEEKTESENADLSGQGIREYLESKLPSYMVPSVIVALDAWPLTANGKVDRTRLPAVDQHVNAQPDYVRPSSSTETKISEIWAECLAMEKVGTRDNFFEIGGDSLLIVKVHRQLTTTFSDVPILILDLFRYTTIYSLAKFIDSPRDDSEAQEIAVIEESSKKRKSSRKNKKSRKIIEEV